MPTVRPRGVFSYHDPVPELERRLRKADKEWDRFKREEVELGKSVPWNDFLEFAAAYLIEHGIKVGRDESWP